VRGKRPRQDPAPLGWPVADRRRNHDQ
jgi:hypothetical protein